MKQQLEKQLEFLELLLKYRQVSKLLNGFLNPFETFVEADGRIRPSFHNSVCVTGRLSCSAPNVEQLPKNNEIANIRNLFISEPDNVLIAEESGDSSMLAALRNNFDIHLSTANDFNNLGLTNQQLIDKTPEHKEAKNKYKKLRDASKTIGFGIAYGKTKFGFAKSFNSTEEYAQKFIDRFLNRYPGLRRAIDMTKEQVAKYGYVKNMSGRKRRFKDFNKLGKWQKERCYRQAFNFKIQSYGADVVKKACIEIIKDKKIKLVNVVHDEVVCEIAKDYIEAAKQYINYCMKHALPISVPWEIEIDYAERYGECK